MVYQFVQGLQPIICIFYPVGINKITVFVCEQDIGIKH